MSPVSAAILRDSGLPVGVPTVIDVLGEERAERLWSSVSQTVAILRVPSNAQNNTFTTTMQPDGTLLLEYERINLSPQTQEARDADRTAVTVDDKWGIVDIRVSDGLVNGSSVVWPPLVPCVDTENVNCRRRAELLLAQFAKMAVASSVWTTANN